MSINIANVGKHVQQSGHNFKNFKRALLIVAGMFGAGAVLSSCNHKSYQEHFMGGTEVPGMLGLELDSLGSYNMGGMAVDTSLMNGLTGTIGNYDPNPVNYDSAEVHNIFGEIIDNLGHIKP